MITELAALPTTSDSTPSGLPFVGELRWGDHVSHFYETAEDLRDCLVPYFRAGLENNERCLWVASEPFGVAEATAALRAAVPDLDALIAAGQIEIVDHRDWYRRQGDLAVDDLPGAWLARVEAALAAGHAGLRVTGNVAFLEASGWHDFMHYEATVHRCFQGQRIVALCSYPIGRCGFEQFLDVIQNHGFAIARRNGRWEVIESASLAETKAALARLNRELEARVQARTADLQTAAVRLRSVLESTTDSVMVLDRDWRLTYLNGRAQARIADGRDLVGVDLWAAFPEALGSAFERQYRKAMEERTPATFEEFYPPLDAWFEVHAYPSDEGLAVFFRDVTDRKRAAEALRLAEERQRLAVEAAAMGTWYWDLQANELVFSDEAKALFGLPHDTAVSYEIFLGALHPEDRERTDAVVKRCLEAGADYGAEYRTIWPDGSVRWLKAKGSAYRNEAGSLVRMQGVVYDVTERKWAEERQRWLTAELDHRVKNILATVQSVAAQTLPPGAATQTFLGRITALVRAHDVLAQHRDGAALRALLEAELEPYRRSSAEHIRLAGDDVVLASTAAQTLGMVLHELATNAAKYGALSTPDGRLDVTWRIDRTPAGRRFVLAWTERGGPAVRPPARRSFGLRLIEFGLAHQLDGTAEFDFRKEGVRCVIELPFTEEIGKLVAIAGETAPADG